MSYIHNCKYYGHTCLIKDNEVDERTYNAFSHDYKIVFVCCSSCDEILEERDSE